MVSLDSLHGVLPYVIGGLCIGIIVTAVLFAFRGYHVLAGFTTLALLVVCNALCGYLMFDYFGKNFFPGIISLFVMNFAVLFGVGIFIESEGSRRFLGLSPILVAVSGFILTPLLFSDPETIAGTTITTDWASPTLFFWNVAAVVLGYILYSREKAF